MADFSEVLASTGYGPIGGPFVFFPAQECDTEGGHDSAQHKSLRVRGADIETTGQKPYTVKLTIPLLNGLQGDGLWPDDLFPETYRQLIDTFEKHPIGTLTHPIRGPMSVHVDGWSEKLTGDVRNGVILEVSFTEHNADSDLSRTEGVKLAESADDTIVRHAADADALGADLSPSPAPLLAEAEQFMRAVEAAEGISRDISAALTALRAACNGRLDSTAGIGVGANGYRLAIEQIIGASYRLQDELVETARPRTYVVPEMMSVARIAALPVVYGDPSLAFLLRGANVIPDPAMVPAGTVLTVPPVP